MDEARLSLALSGLVGRALAEDLVAYFIKLRQDCATKTLERSSSGKFVEIFVQCLQYMISGTHDPKPDVEGYLHRRVENEIGLQEGIRVCASRVARAIYTLRNKRNIAHKNSVDPNIFDLMLTYQGAAWIMAELLRNASDITMEEAGSLIELVQSPVGTLVEEIDGTRLVHADVSIRGEILILLHSHYPERIRADEIFKSMSARNSGSIRNRMSQLRGEKLLHGDAKIGYRLTQAGHQAAVEQIRSLQHS